LNVTSGYYLSIILAKNDNSVWEIIVDSDILNKKDVI